MTAENLSPRVKSWLKGTSDEAPDPRQAARPIMARVVRTRQRSRWWPLPSLERKPASPSGIRSAESQSTSTTPAYDHTLTVTARFQSMFSATKFVVAGVIVALFGGALLIAQPFEQQGGVPGAATGDAGTFSPTGSLAQPRAGHTATLLPDGRVLVVGGSSDAEWATPTAEVWNPDIDTFSPTGSLADGRAYHSATLLPDGRVLLVGGEGDIHEGLFEDYITSAEVWDPSTGAFSAAGSPELIAVTSTTLLADGRVLVVGRVDTGDGRLEPPNLIRELPASAKVWDPATSTFSPVDLDLGADDHAAMALTDGRVLITNDEDPTGSGYSGSAVVWDPVTDTVSPAGSPLPSGLIDVGVSAQGGDPATLLADGRLLVIGMFTSCEIDARAKGTEVDCLPPFDPAGTSGGVPDAIGCTPGDCISLAEVWDPATSTYSPAGVLPGADRERFTVTALADGGALIAGGCSDYHGCYAEFDSAEVWDPDTETFHPTGSLAVTRFTHTATALPDGRVLVVGGWGFLEPYVGSNDLFSHASAEVWEPGDR